MLRDSDAPTSPTRWADIYMRLAVEQPTTFAQYHASAVLGIPHVRLRGVGTAYIRKDQVQGILLAAAKIAKKGGAA